MGTLAKSAKGDRFSQLHTRHADYLARRIHSLQPWVPPSLHADVLQEVWEVVHRRIEDVPHDDLERAWLVKVVRFKLLHHARSHARARRKEDALAPVAVTHVDDGAQFESRQMIDRILDALPEEQREVVVRIELLGESANEVAERANIPPNTVYGRLRLARARISRMGITIGLWLAWLRASARDFVTIPALAVLAGAIVLGTIMARNGSQSSRESTPDPAPTEQSAVHSAGAPEAVPGPPEPAAPTVPEESAVPPAQGAPLVPIASEAGPATGEPATTAPDAAVDRPAPRKKRTAQTTQQPTRSQRFLQRAAEALKQGNGRAALRNLKRHRKKFPGHEQTHIVAAYEIEALCLLGRSDDAKAAFTAAAAKHPRLPIQLQQRKRHKCW